jgi:hypothetical protein
VIEINPAVWHEKFVLIAATLLRQVASEGSVLSLGRPTLERQAG